MERICDLDKCTACALCVNVCPKRCITMKEDTGLGHLHPKINQDICIDCGLCQKKCPVNNTQQLLPPQKAYAGWDKNIDEYRSSTSGGAASAFARYIISQGGVVYGCSVQQDIDIRHIRVDKLEDIQKLKGSKYVQSNMINCYRLINDDLKNGHKVLFVGTPCQIAGLKSYIGKNDQLLYTVDLICHGVPPLAFLQKHIKKVTKGQMPDEIIFRKNLYILLLLLASKPIYSRKLFTDRYKDVYLNTFFDGFSYRKSCYTCRFATPKRVSDITIGDFWGLKDKLAIDHQYGCSVLLPITDKGKELVEAIRPEFNLFERTVEEAVNGNEQLRTPKYMNKRIAIFHKLFPILGITTAYNICVCDKIFKYKIRKLIKYTKWIKLKNVVL